MTRSGGTPNLVGEERFFKVEATCDGRTKHILVSEQRVERDGWKWLGSYLARLTPKKVPDEIVVEGIERHGASRTWLGRNIKKSVG